MVAGNEPDDGSGIVWDSEGPNAWNKMEAHVRGIRIYLTSVLFSAMKEAWGAFSAIVTSTNVETGEVTVGKADATTPNAVKLHLVGSKNTAECSWRRPLKKLDIRVPEDRQYNIPVYAKPVGKVGTVFIFKMNEYENIPRNLKDGQDGTGKSNRKTGTPQPSPASEAAAGKQEEPPKGN